MPHAPIDPRNVVIGAHLILTGYGHWLPNDPRGCGSDIVRNPELRDLGEVHIGRKPIQPSRAELKSFYQRAEPLLQHPTLWFDAGMRDAIGAAIGAVVRERGYTLWAFAVLRNHSHVVIRTHRDRSEIMLEHFAIATRAAMIERQFAPADHPVWSERPYKVFLKTPDQVRTRIDYVKRNPAKEGLEEQEWEFVVPFVVK